MATVELKGAWLTESYEVGQVVHQLTGVLLLTDDQWSTLYFLPVVEGAWGSAEAGTYAWDGHRLTFYHHLVLQGGGGRPLHVNYAESRAEVCDVKLDELQCTIRFPSGNVLHLRRAGA